MQKVNLSDLDPFVRYSKTLLLPYDFMQTGVHACDSRLIYFFSGSARVKLDDRVYNAARGSLFLWTSACRYSIVNTAQEDTKMMTVNFDFIAAPGRPIAALPTISDRQYRKEQALEQLFFEDVPQFNTPLHLDGMHVLESIFSAMSEEFISPKPWYEMILSVLLKQALILTARKSTAAGSDRQNDLVDRVLVYIQESLSGDLSNNALGRRFSYHPNYINRIVQRRTGQTLHQYVLTCRVSKALEMLQTTNLSVTEVSERVGFQSIKHFSQTFKSIYGYSPMHFRDQK